MGIIEFSDTKLLEKLLLRYIIQQQLAGTTDLVVLQLGQTSSVSLHPSLSKGTKQKPQREVMTHQMMATVPITFRGMMPVFLPHRGQGVPSVGACTVNEIGT